MPKLSHAAVYAEDLEALRAFYEKWFGAGAGDVYRNPNTGFSSYFLRFGGDCALEIMNRPGLERGEGMLGYAHIALSVGSEAEVDRLTREMAEAGVKVISGPRTTGDGYYESCVLDPEGNLVEITA